MTYTVKRVLQYEYRDRETAMQDRQHWTHNKTHEPYQFGDSKKMTSIIEEEGEHT
jgi:hypothetical protein